jgi:hypothetical protein
MLYGVHVRLSAITAVLGIAAFGCDGAKSPLVALEIGRCRRRSAYRARGIDDSPHGSSCFGSGLHQRRRRDAHPSELAQLRGNPSAAGSAGQVRNRVHRCARGYSCVVPDQRSELVRRKPHGRVTRNIFVNDLRVVQNTTTPGNGDEPGFAFTVAPNGTITQ